MEKIFENLESLKKIEECKKWITDIRGRFKDYKEMNKYKKVIPGDNFGLVQSPPAYQFYKIDLNFLDIEEAEFLLAIKNIKSDEDVKIIIGRFQIWRDKVFDKLDKEIPSVKNKARYADLFGNWLNGILWTGVKKFEE